MIAIIDYGMGNLRSVEKGFQKVGVEVKVTQSADDVLAADGVVLPGVGAFRDCMKELGRLEILDAVRSSIDAGKPYLGICLGLQILFTESEEFGACSGIDIFRGKVVRFRPEDSALKIPHMGWNTIKLNKENPLYAGIPDESYFYFVHSYYVAPEDADIVATSTCYGAEFVSSVWKDNVFAVQFHPEKSQALGLRMLRNFGEIVGRSS